MTTFKCDSVKIDHALNAIESCVKSAYKHLRLTGFSVLFEILSKFAKNKNPFAPTVYATLSKYVVTYHNDEELRQFLLGNLGEIIKQNQSIPLEVIVTPLVTQIKRFLDDTYCFNTFDFKFFLILAEHKKCSLEVALKLCKLFAQISVK